MPKAATQRSDNLNIRFEPRLKYMAGIAARQERRSLSNLIENSVETHLRSVKISTAGKQTPLLDLVSELWSIHEADRFVRFATHLPFLLTFEEEELWHLIQVDDSLWKEGPQGEPVDRDGNPDFIKIDVLRTQFSNLQAMAEASAAHKPTVRVGGIPFRGGRLESAVSEANGTESKARVRK